MTATVLRSKGAQLSPAGDGPAANPAGEAWRGFLLSSMFDDLGWKSPANLVEVKSSKAQGQHREGLSEGSAEQNRDPMNGNRIRGTPSRYTYGAGRTGVENEKMT
jgi:hypothetical protein